MRNKQKQEALARMELLGLMEEQKRAFETDGTIFVFNNPAGLPIKIDSKTSKMVQQFEERFNCLVYAIVKATTAFGTQEAFLYVSETEDEWEGNREDILNHEPFVYVHNPLSDILSEFCTIVIDQVGTGRLVRLG